MRKATTAIALATLIPDWVSTSDISSVYKWLRDDAVLPYGILRRQGTRRSKGSDEIARLSWLRNADINGLNHDI